jgi:uncharacterized damage-inducible protein DinB
MIVVASLFPVVVAAQAPRPASPPPLDGVMISFARFADIFGGRLLTAFDSIPATRYDYRPTPVQQTVGYIAQHVVYANYGLCSEFSGMRQPVTAKDSLSDSIKAHWPKDTLVRRLAASLAFCDTAIQRAGPLTTAALASNLLAFETDLAEHYSQLSSYMRLMGMVPPSALPARQRTAIDLPAAALAAYVGVYEFAPGWELRVTTQNGGLYGQSSLGGVPVRLWPESATDFFLKEADAQVTFARDARGTVTGLVAHQFGRNRPAHKIR